MSVEIDTERVRALASDLRAHRDAVNGGPRRCVALTLPGAGGAVAALVGQVTTAEQVLTETVAGAADACAAVLDETICSVIAVDRYPS